MMRHDQPNRPWLSALAVGAYSRWAAPPSPGTGAGGVAGAHCDGFYRGGRDARAVLHHVYGRHPRRRDSADRQQRREVARRLAVSEASGGAQDARGHAGGLPGSGERCDLRCAELTILTTETPSRDLRPVCQCQQRSPMPGPAPRFCLEATSQENLSRQTGDTDPFIAGNAVLVLQALSNPDGNLSRQAVIGGINRRANGSGEVRVYQGLTD
jgi:hypothetical protein